MIIMSKKKNFILEFGKKGINLKKNDIIKISLILDEIAYAISNDGDFDVLDFYKIIPFKGAGKNFIIYLCKFMEKFLENSDTKKVIIGYMATNGMLDKGKNRKIMELVDECELDEVVLKYILQENLPMVNGVCDVVSSFYHGEKVDLKDARIEKMNYLKNKEIQSKSYIRRLNKINCNS